MNSGLTPHQRRGHTETDLGLKSHPKTGKDGVDLAIPGMVDLSVSHHSTAAPRLSY